MPDEISIDQIVADANSSTNTEIPMGDTAPPPEAAPPTPQEYEYQADGRGHKASIEKLLELAGKGHTSARAIGRLQKQIEDYGPKIKQLEHYDKTYRPIDEWAAKNPDQWKSLFSQWQQAQYNAGQPVQSQEQIKASLPPEILQEIKESKEFRENLIQKETTQRTQAADQGLDKEIGSIRKQYSNLDFDAPDEHGNSLEYQILEHATKNGIPSFRAAFRDYCFDKLSTFSETKGLERGGKTMPQKTKDGLLGKSTAPAKGRPVSDLIKNRNYDQIHELVLAELGLGS